MSNTVSNEPHSKSHLLYLDGLRAVAAIFVVMHHAILQEFDFVMHDETGVKKKFIQIFFFGHYSVNLFIVLSGFCLMLPVLKSGYTLKHGAFNFYRRRIKRILPPYYIAMAFSLILIFTIIGERTGTHWDISVPVSYTDVITHILLIHDFFVEHAVQINHAFWSISVECRIYIFFPLIIWLWRKQGPLLTLLYMFVLTLLMFGALIIINKGYPHINIAMPGVNPYIILFTIGMLAADISFSNDKLKFYRTKLPWGLLLGLMTVIFLAFQKYGNQISLSGYFQGEILDILFAFWSLCLLVFVSISKNDTEKYNWLKAILSWQPLVFIGTFAYSLYLIHAPLLQVLSQYVLPLLKLSKFSSAIFLMTVGTAIIIGISYIFFNLFERPFLNKGKNNSLKKTEINAAADPAI